LQRPNPPKSASAARPGQESIHQDGVPLTRNQGRGVCYPHQRLLTGRQISSEAGALRCKHLPGEGGCCACCRTHGFLRSCHAVTFLFAQSERARAHELYDELATPGKVTKAPGGIQAKSAYSCGHARRTAQTTGFNRSLLRRVDLFAVFLPTRAARTLEMQRLYTFPPGICAVRPTLCGTAQPHFWQRGICSSVNGSATPDALAHSAGG